MDLKKGISRCCSWNFVSAAAAAIAFGCIALTNRKVDNFKCPKSYIAKAC